MLEAIGGYLIADIGVPYLISFPLKDLLGKTRYLMPEAFAVFYRED